MAANPAPDCEDLAALQRGEDAALNRIMMRWQRPLQGYAFRYVQNQADAQELVAETFVRMYQHRTGLRKDTLLSAWLFTTLTNLCHNHYRWRRRHPTVSMAALTEGNCTGSESWQGSEPSPGAALERDEALQLLRRAVDALPHDLKSVMLLHHYEHLSYQEIAAVVGCSERGVETRLYRARKRLRSELAGVLERPAPALLDSPEAVSARA